MDKKLKELSGKLNEKLEALKALDPEKDGQAMAAALDEVDSIQKAYDLEQRRYEAEKAQAGRGYEKDRDGKGREDKPSGFAILAKCLRGQPLTEAERKAITPDDAVTKAMLTGANAANGEVNLIPEDVDATIRELRKSYVSAKSLATVIPTGALTGSYTWENGAPAGLVNFTDGDDIPAGTEPRFTNVKFAIALYGIIIPVSNLLTAVEAAGLTAYLNRWFVRNAVITENKAIFAALAKDKTPVAIAKLADLGKSMTVDLDPSCLIGAVIATNQSGFAAMAEETDGNGRPMLQPDPADITRQTYKGYHVTVFPDSVLPNIDETHAPVFYGLTTAGVYFVELTYHLFDSSAHAGFGKNQTHFRVIEGFDVIPADKSAYCYGSYALTGGAAG